MPIFLVKGAPRGDPARCKGPVILVTNLLTEGRGMWHFTAGRGGAADGRGDRPARRRRARQHRPARREKTLARYHAEHKRPLELGDVPASCEVVTGEFWCGDIARHDRRRLAQAVWAVLARRLF